MTYGQITAAEAKQLNLSPDQVTGADGRVRYFNHDVCLWWVAAVDLPDNPPLESWKGGMPL